MALSSVAQYTLLVFGGLLCFGSAMGLISPNWLRATVRSAWAAPKAMPMAIGVRLLLGSALIYYAPNTEFPTLLRVFGVFGLCAAVGLPLLGWQRVDNILQWIDSWPAWVLRVCLLLGAAAGIFLLYVAR